MCRAYPRSYTPSNSGTTEVPNLDSLARVVFSERFLRYSSYALHAPFSNFLHSVLVKQQQPPLRR
jgi:hypothetical protein